MLHIAKLAVGIASVEHLGQVQAGRAAHDPPLRHRTRHAPRRRDEVLAGGSLYWVVAGIMLVRQPILDIVGDALEDGSPACALVLSPDLVRTNPRATRPFQGWRYLLAGNAPADLADNPGGHQLPPDLQASLQTLCLI